MTGQVMVFAPAPQLTVTIEQRGELPDIHLHAGGQGIWQAAMARSMGVPVVLCAAFGGETGRVVRHLLLDRGIDVRAVEGHSRTGTYVHDRRGGFRIDVAHAAGDPLGRHEIDELYGLALTEGLRSRVCLLSGPGHPPVVGPQVYRRLAADLRRNGVTVVADLSGEHLGAATAGGLRLLKVSHTELLTDGRASSDALDDLVDAACVLHDEGAETVVVSRAERPALVVIGDEVAEVVAPRLDEVDSRGAGDSMTGAVAACLARGESVIDAIRTGAAAGALNVTRHGLGTGQAEAVMELRQRIRLRPVRDTGASTRGWEGPHVQASPDQLWERIRGQ